jgi:hypothetical protein
LASWASGFSPSPVFVPTGGFLSSWIMAPSQDFYIQPGSWRFADTAPQARATHCSGDGIYPDPVGRSPSPLRFCIFQFPISSFCFLPSSFCLLVSISPTLRSYTVIPNGAGRLFLPLSLVRFSQCRAACPPRAPTPPTFISNGAGRLFLPLSLVQFSLCRAACPRAPHTTHRHSERSRTTFSCLSTSPPHPSFRTEQADFFFRFRSCESVGLRREKSLFLFHRPA